MSTSKLTIKSLFKNYTVSFTTHAFEDLNAIAQKRKCYVVIDETVAKRFAKELKLIAHPERTFLIRAVESNKNLKTVEKFIDFLLSRNFKRNDCLVAIGGGIIEDVAGFTSSILFRGIDWIFVPTTLLAQADSCIGSKNCINVGTFKNQLGTFFPPTQVILDTVFLKTLPKDDIRSGLGEIIKFYILDSRASLNLIQKSYTKSMADPKLMLMLIRRSLQIKKRIIEIDEFDRGIRNTFNYGHTFGHAIESVTKYRINHGQAITLGMGLANYISLKLGYLKQSDYDQMQSIIHLNSPEFKFSKGQEDNYLLSLSKDKKNIGSQLTCILIKGPGQGFKTALPFDKNLRSLIRTYFAQNS